MTVTLSDRSFVPLALAPGARIVVRTEEWLVRRVDPSADGGHLLTCDGISDLVRGQSALFLTELEDAIEVLDPATTVLVADMCQIGVSYLIALLLHYKINRAIPVKVNCNRYDAADQIDGVRLGGELAGGKPNLGSKDKVPLMPAVSLDHKSRTRCLKLSMVIAFKRVNVN